MDTLDYLRRGGRIGSAAALVGSILQVKPILTFANGRVAPFEKERTKKRALARLKELVVAEAAHGDEAHLTVMHAAAPAEAAELAAELGVSLGVAAPAIMDLVPAIVTHAGPGCWPSDSSYPKRLERGSGNRVPRRGFAGPFSWAATRHDNWAALPGRSACAHITQPVGEAIRMPVNIITINTADRRDVNRFIDLPFRLYQGCAAWVPPLIDDVKLMLDRRKYAFYEHSDAQFLLAERDGRAVGRIAVLDNRHYNEHWQSQTAFFYLFDAEDDREAAIALFGAAEAWAQGRKLTKIVGAKGFLQGDGIGVLVDGFEHHPAVGIPYNHAVLRRARSKRPGTLANAISCPPTCLATQLPPAGRRSPRDDGTPRLRDQDVRQQEGVDAPGFRASSGSTTIPSSITGSSTLITEAEAKVIGERLLMIADPKLIKLVMKGDEIAGFLFGFPDISDGIRRAKGRICPFGWLWILLDFRAPAGSTSTAPASWRLTEASASTPSYTLRCRRRSTPASSSTPIWCRWRSTCSPWLTRKPWAAKSIRNTGFTRKR